MNAAFPFTIKHILKELCHLALEQAGYCTGRVAMQILVVKGEWEGLNLKEEARGVSSVQLVTSCRNQQMLRNISQ